MSSVENVYDLMDRAEELPSGPEKMAIFEESVRLCDSLGEQELGYRVRMELIEEATFNGFEDKALVAFTWCLAKFDESPDDYDDHQLLWVFKWIVGQIVSYASMPKAKILELQSEFAKRLQQFDYSSRPADYMRMKNFMVMGDLEEANLWNEKWQLAARDSMADCRACEQHSAVTLFCYQGRSEDALRMAKPIFEGKMTCASIPQSTYGRIVRPLLRLGRKEELAKNYKKIFKELAKNRNYLWAVGEFLIYLAQIRDLKTAIKVVESHLPWAIECPTDTDRLEFFAPALATLKVCQSESPTTSIRFPASWETTDVSVAIEILDQRCHDLAGSLDQRNGNDFYQSYVKEALELSGC